MRYIIIIPIISTCFVLSSQTFHAQSGVKVAGAVLNGKASAFLSLADQVACKAILSDAIVSAVKQATGQEAGGYPQKWHPTLESIS